MKARDSKLVVSAARSFEPTRICLILVLALTVSELMAVERPIHGKNVGLKILVDPQYGGDDSGPVIFDRPAKTLTLNFGKRLYEELKTRHYNVYLSRDSDRYLMTVDRKKIAHDFDADVHIVIDIAPNSHECVYLYIPTETQGFQPPVGDQAKGSIFHIVNTIIHSKSKKLAREIEDRLADREICATVEARNLQILDVSATPIVVVQIRVSMPHDQQLDVIKAKLKKGLLRAILESLQELEKKGM